MTYHKLNVYTGWVVWLIATIVYLLTIEPTTSFWDTGEFISSAYKLQVGHPPGAPFFMLVARFFGMWFDPEHVAMAMNALSAFCSSFTILFLFWSITHFAKKLVYKAKEEVTQAGNWAVMASGVVGALAYTFSDSFWFSAVEGEVYAMSSLFTAVVFWAILKWESMSEKGGSLRWIVLIAYLMGLSIGVHLLNLLAIPAIAFVFYFKRYEVTIKGLAITSLVSVAVLGIIQSLIIPGTVKLASKFELYMVNDMGMPFNSGVITYILLIIAVIAGLLVVSRRSNWPILNLSVLSIMMVLIGYSTFAVVVIRSAANPPMDENNPENVFTLLSYLNREQYGSRPLLTGQYWNTPIDYDDPYSGESKNYVKSYSVRGGAKNSLVRSFKFKFEAEQFLEDNEGKGYMVVDEYIGSKSIDGYNYVDHLTAVLPRMHSTDARDIEAYKEWSNFQGWNEAKKRPRVEKTEEQFKQIEAELQQLLSASNYYASIGDQANYTEARRQFAGKYIQLKKKAEKLMPSQAENLRFFVDYQVDWMYWRYFMWNFSGRQNDVQGHGDILDGNWLTGINFIDKQKLGSRDSLTSYMENNRGYNTFFLLPFLLGLIGFVFQVVKKPKDFTVTGLLFLLTGLAIVVYLNQDPFQPRERDYAYVGSFYAFAIWIGLGVTALYYAATQMTKQELTLSAGAGIGIGIILYIMELVTGNDHFVSLCILFMAGLTAVVLAALQFGVKSALKDPQKAILVGVLCLSIPMVMAYDGWDDHSRAGRRTGVDFAQNYLESLALNAIVITNGDNDTFPLWYAQEVEGIRTDVRVVNNSLLQTDWYADQMKRDAYEGKAVPISLTEEQYRQGTRDAAEMQNSDKYLEMQTQFDFFLDDARFNKEGREPYFPSNKWKLTIDSAHVIAMGAVDPKNADLIVDEMTWERKGRLLKNSILIYDIIRNNNWERPIYFASTIGEEAFNGLGDYFQLEGLAYRLVPIKTKSDNLFQKGRVDTDVMFDNVMNKFKWGNMDDAAKNIYMDENNLRMVSNLRMQFANLADALTDEGDTERAIIALDKCMEVMPEKVVPYDEQILYIAEEYAEAGDLEKGKELFDRYFELVQEKLEYLESLEPEKALSIVNQFERDFQVMSYTLGKTADTIQDSVFMEEIGNKFTESYDTYRRIEEQKIELLRTGRKGSRIEF